MNPVCESCRLSSIPALAVYARSVAEYRSRTMLKTSSNRWMNRTPARASDAPDGIGPSNGATPVRCLRLASAALSIVTVEIGST
jgi:hypothetical protein